MNLLASILICVSWHADGLDWYSPYYRVRIADAYDFQISFEAAKAQYYHAHTLYELIQTWSNKHRDQLDEDGKARLDALVGWQYYRQHSWGCLREALDPANDFVTRRRALDSLRDDLAVLGGGVVEYWKYRRMPAPVWE